MPPWSSHPKCCINKMNMSNQVISKFSQMRQYEASLDYTLNTSDGGSFPVHRAYLSAFSDYFFALLTSSNSMIEGNQKSIMLESVSAAGLQPVLDYIYGGKTLGLSDKNLEEVVGAASYLQVQWNRIFLTNVIFNSVYNIE